VSVGKQRENGPRERWVSMAFLVCAIYCGAFKLCLHRTLWSRGSWLSFILSLHVRSQYPALHSLNPINHQNPNQPIQCTSPSPPSPSSSPSSSPPSPLTTAPTQPSLPPTTNPRSPPAPAPPPRPAPPRQSPRPPQSQSQLQPQEQEASIPPLQARARAVAPACTIRPWDCGM